MDTRLNYAYQTAESVVPSVTEVTVSPATIEVQKGETQKFRAIVTAQGGASRSVTWAVYGNQSAATAITNDGTLSIAADETATTLTVKATSEFDGTKFSTAAVTVTEEPVQPKVISVTVSPSTANVQKGRTKPFTADVAVQGGASQSVTWAVYGNQAAATAIANDGMLTIAADETATTLTVKATSDFDGTKFGTATVTVTEVPVQQIVLQGIVQPDIITDVPNGTLKTAEALGLPASVTLATYGGGTVTAAVHWNLSTSSYNPSSADAQTFPVEGTVTLPSEVTNPNNVALTVTVSVSVKAQARSSDGSAPTLYTITASAGENGSISPSGTVKVISGGSQSFTITANDGYQIAGVTADGQNIGKVSTYSFSNVTGNHSISASFVKEEIVVTPPDESTDKPTDNPTDKPILDDVKAGAWYSDDVDYVVAHGLMKGTGDHTFSPNADLTRGMIATILGQHYGLDASKYGENSFDDVDGKKYYAPYVEWVRDAGIAGGSGTTSLIPMRRLRGRTWPLFS